MKINTLIIDDEELARMLLKENLKEIPDICVIGEANNGFDGIKIINKEKPDLIFLDVQMPKLNGFEMLELLDHKPEIIFTTAYDQYALKAFEQNAVDYLLKPFTIKRLLEALNRVMERLKNGEQSQKDEAYNTDFKHSEEYLDRIVVKTGSKIRLIPTSEIYYLKAEDDYVGVVIKGERHLKQKTMKYFEENLDPKEFVRIHRSYIVKLEMVKSIELYEKDSYMVILKNGDNLPVSKSGYMKLKESLRF